MSFGSDIAGEAARQTGCVILAAIVLAFIIGGSIVSAIYSVSQ